MSPGPLDVLASFAEEFQLDTTLLALPASAPRLVDLPASLHPRLAIRLDELGFKSLYSHQAEAISHALKGEDVVLSTGTSSGKTLSFLIPILQSCFTEPNAKCLILYPTKALAQDQLAAFLRIIGDEPVRAATYDADTPKSQRSSIRKSAHIVITNPDMLHIGILPSHELWSGFLRNLKYIVIDELHTYTGVFGSHVAGVIRRLLRLCDWHGAKPVVIASTATTADPAEHFQSLTSRSPFAVTEDGSPKPERKYAFLQRRLVPEARPATPNQLTASLLAKTVSAGLYTLAFNPSRNSSELVRKYAVHQLEMQNIEGGEQIDSYRGGYSAKERRVIEKRLRDGKLLGISSTNALELGIDIGGLDVVVMNGYPGSVVSFWQQSGRAGRGLRPGTSVLIGGDNPIDFLTVSDPERYLFSGFDPTPLNFENPIILAQQLRCAAYERAISPDELVKFGKRAQALVDELESSGELTFSADRYFYPVYEAPAPKVNIRSSGGDLFTIQTGIGELGTMEYWRVLQSGFPGAVYLHRGQTYVVEDLNFESKQVKVREQEVAYYTVALGQSSSHELYEIGSAKLGEYSVGLVSVQIHEQVTEFQKRSMDGSQAFEAEGLELPAIEYQTLAVRFDVLFEDEDVIPSLHGFEHALLATAPLIAGCSSQDIGSSWFAELPEHDGPVAYIYDRAPGGIGLAEILFDKVTEWISAAEELLLKCGCVEGCPRCLLLPRCPYRNEALSKQGALEWLSRAK